MYEVPKYASQQPFIFPGKALSRYYYANDRIYRCDCCGNKMDRDVQASVNLIK
ncbi:zinc ribbon domain-containing protein, partial [Ruminobacter sp.]|uniref:zinc ribbon domain-containing protein n=1 Tax=Ruminobacter sp. TaxID=2774296 RepID=UPI00338DE22B